MVPAAIQILTAATLFAKNLARPVVAPDMSDARIARLAKLMVLVITAAAVTSAIFSHATLVSLLLLGYSGITQLLPGVVLGLFSKKVRTAAVFAGLVTGIAIVAILGLSGHDPFIGINAGFVALCCNFAVALVLSWAAPAKSFSFDLDSDSIPPLSNSSVVRE